MLAFLASGLFACYDEGGGTATRFLYAHTLGFATALLTYISWRRWSVVRGSAARPYTCLVLFLLHPAWLGGAGTDCGRGMYEWAVLFTTIAATCVLTQWLPDVRQWLPFARPKAVESLPEDRLAGPVDTRFFAGEPPRVTGVYAGEAPHPVAPRGEVDWAVLAATGRRLLALIPIGMFANTQYAWYLRETKIGEHVPHRVLGPLYYFVTTSPADDWIGYALLAVAVPCILSVVVWPNRWTALVASLTVLAWVAPGAVEAYAKS